jgi:hypothetical protein
MKLGKQIVVIDNGFVHVGDCSFKDGFLVIENGFNIRKWGTTQGLSQLAAGPTKETIVDPLTRVLVPVGRVVFYLSVIGGWK